MNLIRYLFLVTALPISFFACQKHQQKNPGNSESFSFGFMTDIHVQLENFATDGLLQAIDTINKLNPDFAITGGDNIADVGSK